MFFFAMSLPDAFESYTLWLALKRHFSPGSYDFKKYNGKLKTKRSSFDRFNGKRFFYTFSSRYKSQLKDFYVSVLCRDQNIGRFVGEFLDSKYDDEYKSWIKRTSAISKTISSDFNTLFEYMEEKSLNFSEILLSKTSALPAIVQMENRDIIAPETIVYLNRITGFLGHRCCHPNWEDNKIRLQRYSTFVNISEFDMKKLTKTLREEINSNQSTN